MPTTLPDPVLALSMASLQKLNTADVDQLANLWNVFTKCKESLESGRRLENLSWRLWFREAHLLPPDTSLSDLTDFTPLDTPLMSRRSSIAGSFQPRTMSTFIPSQQQQQSQQQPSNSLTSRALHAASIAMATTPANRTTKVIQTELSDPEDGEDWSSEDDDSEEEEGERQVQNDTKTQNRGRTREQAFSPSTSSYPTKSSLKSVKNNSAITSPKSISSPLARVDEQQQDVTSIIPTTKSSIIQPGDRKRAVSSSSAFGSRARVKQHNMQRRRRPLSFQQAIESLLLDGHENDLSLRKRNFDFGNGSVASLPKSIDESIGRKVEDIESFSSNLTISSDQKLPQNSAPAEFSRPSTPQRMNSISSAIVEKKPVRRVSIADVEETKESKPSSRFFVGGASFEGSEHSLESENSNSIIKHNSTKSPVQAFKNLHPTFSDAGSNDGNRKASSSRPHHHNHHHHHPHPHHHHPHHGKALTGNTRIKSALNLHKNGGKAKQNHVRIASISKEPAHEIAPEQEEEEIASDKKRQPVKFTMGSVGSESDEDSISNRKSAKASKSVDSDEWASDSSTDSEEERKKTDERRKREERERVENMFKKIPIRSQSAADVRHLQPQSSNNELHHHHHQSDESSVEDLQSVSPAPPPIRSLLSTIFHPEREGDFATANSTTNSKNHKQKRKTSHEGSEIAQTVNNLRKNNESEMESNTPANIPRLPSIGSYMNNVGMKMSKSAVALPVLSTLGSRSSTSLSRNTAVFDDASSEEDKNSDGQSSTFGHPSRQSNNSEAVERLNELAQSKQKQKNKKRQQKRSSSNADSIRRSSADEGGQIRNRTSNSSLDVQVQPDFNEEEMILQHRRTSEPFEIPSTGNSIQRSKSAVNVPAGLPQSPRTTRRNMLRDELSESLRQNLLWERQSRNRMLGIGGNRLMNDNVQQQSNKPSFPALTTTTSEPSQSHNERNVVQSQPPQPSFNRNQSVLGGNALRPLTQRSSTTNNPTNATNDENTVSSSSQRRSRVNYSGDFHHTGW